MSSGFSQSRQSGSDFQEAYPSARVFSACHLSLYFQSLCHSGVDRSMVWLGVHLQGGDSIIADLTHLNQTRPRRMLGDPHVGLWSSTDGFHDRTMDIPVKLSHQPTPLSPTGRKGQLIDKSCIQHSVKHKRGHSWRLPRCISKVAETWGPSEHWAEFPTTLKPSLWVALRWP